MQYILVIGFEERFREAYSKEYKNNKNIHFSSSEEMREFFDDGIAILEFIKKLTTRYQVIDNFTGRWIGSVPVGTF